MNGRVRVCAWARWVWAGLILGLLSGCVYLRLLEVKDQFAGFDRFFLIVAGPDGFALHFLEPVLLAPDVRHLTRIGPSETAFRQGRVVWTYRVVKPEMTDIRVVFHLTFDRQGRVSVWDFSPLVLRVLPADVLEAGLRGLGKAEIAAIHRRIEVRPELSMETAALLPTLASVERVIGEPWRIRSEDSKLGYLYHFRLQTADVDEGYEDRRELFARLDFGPPAGRLRKLFFRFAGIEVLLDFSRQ